MLKTTDPMTPDVRNDVWSRGCEYVFEHYENRGVVVYCYGRSDRLAWSGCVQWSDGDRILDVIRDARESAALQRAEYGG